MFADLLYPGNPERRDKVRQKTIQARFAFTNFEETWNNYAKTFNNMIREVTNQEKLPSKSKIELPSVSFNPEKDTIDDMVKKINSVIEKAKTASYQFSENVKTTLDAKASKDFGTLMSYDNIGDLEKGFEDWTPPAIGSLIAIYLSIQLKMLTVSLAANGIALSAGVVAAGGIGLGILSAAGFFLSDLIISAFTGASERKKLENANKKLNNLLKDVIEPLEGLTGEIGAEKSAINSGQYRISKSVILIKIDDNWVAMDIPVASKTKSKTEERKYLNLVG